MVRKRAIAFRRRKIRKTWYGLRDGASMKTVFSRKTFTGNRNSVMDCTLEANDGYPV